MTKPTIKTKDVAERLGVSPQTIRNMVNDNRIPHVRVTDSMVRFEPDAIETWIEQRRQGQSSQ